MLERAKHMASGVGMKQKLTKEIVDGTQPQPRDYIVFDTKLTGFGLKLTFRTLTVHYLRLATGRVSEGELLARTVDGGLYREQLKYLRLNRC